MKMTTTKTITTPVATTAPKPLWQILPVAFLMLTAATTALAQPNSEEAFSWSGIAAPGHRVIVYNINGPVEVLPSDGNNSERRVEIRAVKKWKSGKPTPVRIEQLRTAQDDIVVCAMWHPESRCTGEGINTPRSSVSVRGNTSVHFTVHVPAGTHVDINTVNGRIDISDVSSGVNARTVNGGIRIRTINGPVNAKTVNGSINALINATNGYQHDSRLETVNGSITVTAPPDLSALVSMKTVNGSVKTDIPMTVSGTQSGRNLQGETGNGGPRLDARTVNGSISLRKINAR